MKLFGYQWLRMAAFIIAFSAPAFAAADETSCGSEFNRLFDAICRNDIDSISALIASSIELDAQDDLGFTALHKAAYHNRLHIAAMLIAAGANVNARDIEQSTPLLVAAIRIRALRGSHMARLLIEESADIHAENIKGETALHWAAVYGDRPLIKILLDAGADVHAASNDGYTPLHGAASGGYSAAVHLLLEAGAKVSVQYGDGKTPLHMAARTHDIEAMEMLVDAGADVNKRDQNGKTALHYLISTAGNYFDCKAAAEGFLFLVNVDADVNAQDQVGEAPLHLAMQRSCTRDIVPPLLDAGAEVNAIRQDGATPLYFAAREGSENIVSLLLAHGASVNLTMGASIGSPLAAAVSEGHEDIALKLMDLGADVNVTDQNGEPLFSLAQKARNEWGDPLDSVVVVLMEMNPELVPLEPSTFLEKAVSRDAHEVAARLLAAGADVNIGTSERWPPGSILHVAVSRSDPEMVELLVGHGVNLDSLDTYYGNTALHDAVAWNSEASFKKVLLLAEAGASINIRNKDGETPLDNAIQEDSSKTVALLLEHGADPNASNPSGWAPLHYALSDNGPETTKIVRMLVNKGSNANAQTALAGWTPLHMAAHLSRPNPAVVELLLKHGAEVNRKMRLGGWTPLHLALQRSGELLEASAMGGAMARVTALLRRAGGRDGGVDREQLPWIFHDGRTMKIRGGHQDEVDGPLNIGVPYPELSELDHLSIFSMRGSFTSAGVDERLIGESVGVIPGLEGQSRLLGLVDERDHAHLLVLVDESMSIVELCRDGITGTDSLVVENKPPGRPHRNGDTVYLYITKNGKLVEGFHPILFNSQESAKPWPDGECNWKRAKAADDALRAAFRLLHVGERMDVSEDVFRLPFRVVRSTDVESFRSLKRDKFVRGEFTGEDIEIEVGPENSRWEILRIEANDFFSQWDYYGSYSPSPYNDVLLVRDKMHEERGSSEWRSVAVGIASGYGYRVLELQQDTLVLKIRVPLLQRYPYSHFFWPDSDPILELDLATMQAEVVTNWECTYNLAGPFGDFLEESCRKQVKLSTARH